jgi:hypothetical protein
MLAAAILISTVLYLVDKNHVWPQFWKITATCLLLIALSGGGYYFYAEHRAQVANSQHGPWENYQSTSPSSAPAPKTSPK